MNKRFNWLNTNLIVTPSKNKRSCSTFKRFSFSNPFSKFNNIIKLTLTRQQCSPCFLITILNPVTIKEQMCKVISWVNTKVSTRCNQRKEESRNISSSSCYTEEEIIIVNNPLVNHLFDSIIIAVSTVIIQEHSKLISHLLKH